MSTWEFVVYKKNNTLKKNRVVQNYDLFFSRNFIYTGVIDIDDNRIHTNNIAMVEFFFDIKGFVPYDFPDKWIFNNPNNKYNPNLQINSKSSFLEILKKNKLQIVEDSKLFINNNIENENVKELEKKNNNIYDFCYDFIYKNKCKNIKCNMIHSKSINFAKNYLKNKNFKKNKCSNFNCKFKICLFKHFDDDKIWTE